MLGSLENDSDVSRREFVWKAALAAGTVGIAGAPPNEAD
jgi:hypothetical protein